MYFNLYMILIMYIHSINIFAQFSYDSNPKIIAVPTSKGPPPEISIFAGEKICCNVSRKSQVQVFFGADAVAPCCEASVDLGSSVSWDHQPYKITSEIWDGATPSLSRVTNLRRRPFIRPFMGGYNFIDNL